MLAGVRQIACGLAMVMAGFLVVALAQLTWAALFFTDDALAVFIYEPRWWTAGYAFVGYYEGLIGVGVVMWLIGYTIRRVAKSMLSGRPA
jgi:hypothetical protein